MSIAVRLKVILLKKTQWGESHLIVHGVSSKGERQSALARGALQSKKRFAGGVLDPLQYVELMMSRSSKQAQLQTIEEARVIRDFIGLRDSYEKIETAFWMANIVYQFSQEADPVHLNDGDDVEFMERGLFDLCGNGLAALEKETDFEKFRCHFGLKILWHQGILDQKDWMTDFLKTPLGGAIKKDSQFFAHLDFTEQTLKTHLSNS